MWRVIWSDKVDKQLRKIPDHIQRKFRAWAVAVEEDGLPAVRRQPGFHDEPLKGIRKGQRSVRLNIAYRAIYVERSDGEVELVEVIEVNKHEY
jgi:proteic killer suppression protein